MTPPDLAQIAKEIVALYGTCQPWVRCQEPDAVDTGRVAKHFAAYAPFQVTAALGEFARTHPDRAPIPNQLLDLLRVDHARRNEGLRNPIDCKHPQPWAFVEGPAGSLPEGLKPGQVWAMCLHCHTEFPRDREGFKTDGEIAEAERMKGVPAA